MTVLISAQNFATADPDSRAPKAWVCGRSLTGIASSNPAGGMYVSCECCVLSDGGLRVGPITRPE